MNKEIIKKINNQNYIDISERIEPNYEIFNELSIIYYNNFQLVDENIYNLIFGQSNKSIRKYSNNYCLCIFMNEYILINLSKFLNKSKFIIELGKINENYTFNANYLFIYDYT